MAKLSLKDIARYSDTMSGDELQNNPDMQAYVVEMQEVGQEVLKNLSFDELAVVVSFMQSMFILQMLNSNPMLAFVFMSSTKEVGLAMAKALQFAIGISLSEDWR